MALEDDDEEEDVELDDDVDTRELEEELLLLETDEVEEEFETIEVDGLDVIEETLDDVEVTLVVVLFVERNTAETPARTMIIITTTTTTDLEIAEYLFAKVNVIFGCIILQINTFAEKVGSKYKILVRAHQSAWIIFQ